MVSPLPPCERPALGVEILQDSNDTGKTVRISEVREEHFESEYGLESDENEAVTAG